MASVSFSASGSERECHGCDANPREKLASQSVTVESTITSRWSRMDLTVIVSFCELGGFLQSMRLGPMGRITQK